MPGEMEYANRATLKIHFNIFLIQFSNKFRNNAIYQLCLILGG